MGYRLDPPIRIFQGQRCLEHGREGRSLRTLLCCKHVSSVADQEELDLIRGMVNDREVMLGGERTGSGKEDWRCGSTAPSGNSHCGKEG